MEQIPTEVMENNPMQYWVCSNNGVRRYGESCNLNNNCKFPKCLNQAQVRSEEQLKNDLDDFKNAYIERNDKCNEHQLLCEGKEKEIAELRKEVDKNYGFIWKAFHLSVCDLPQEEQDKYWLEFLTANNL